MPQVYRTFLIAGKLAFWLLLLWSVEGFAGQGKNADVSPILAANSAGAANAGASVERGAGTGVRPTPQLNPGQDSDAYKIGVEDVLQISVWREPELSMEVVVRPDGMITMPLLNDINVVGLDTQGLRALLTEKLKPFVNEPQVTVIVRQIRSRMVYLIGEVPRPGAYPLIGTKTVLQLLAQAGGVGAFAKAKAIYIMRDAGGGKTSRISFNYKRALAAGGDKYDVALSPGDMIVVP